MTLSAPTRLTARSTVAAGTVIPFPSTETGAAHHVLIVSLSSSDGRTLQAIGGGNTLAAALAFARDSCPTDAIWQPIGWTDLYGD